MKYTKKDNCFIDEFNTEMKTIHYHYYEYMLGGGAICNVAKINIKEVAWNQLHLDEVKCNHCGSLHLMGHNDAGPTTIFDDSQTNWFYQGVRIR